MSRRDKKLAAVEEDLRISIVTDGTVTKATIYRQDGPGFARTFGTGTARRRKGDPRSLSIGTLIAAQRAFQAAADGYAALLAARGIDAG